MTDDSPSDYRRAFVARLKAARNSRELTQEDMASKLGVSQSRYSKYEGARKSYIPMHLIPHFCLITGVSLEWLITGRGAGPAVAPEPKPLRRRRTAKGKRAA